MRAKISICFVILTGYLADLFVRFLKKMVKSTAYQCFDNPGNLPVNSMIYPPPPPKKKTQKQKTENCPFDEKQVHVLRFSPLRTILLFPISVEL